jgi:hypothetical protein
MVLVIKNILIVLSFAIQNARDIRAPTSSRSWGSKLTDSIESKI